MSMGEMPLTNTDQGIPLPSPSVAGTGDGRVQFGVGLLNVRVGFLGALVDLRDRGLLLMDQLGDFIVQLAELDHVLFDLADSGGSLQSGLTGIVGLARAGSGGLHGEKQL